MEEKGKVFLVEDNEDLRGIERLWIEDSGHEVVLIARTRQEALDKIEQAKGKGVNIAVVDGSLGTGPNDGLQVAKALKEAIPGIVIISFSGEKVTWGHFNPMKPEDITKLGEIITEALS